MSQHLWRKRLRQAVENSGKSLREVSLAAGCSPGYLHSILRTNREPTIARLVSLCGVLGVSVSHVVLGTKDGKAAALAASNLANTIIAARDALANYERSIGAGRG
jgi:transcriptional regulator with XRE-family HTH domain